MTDFEFLVFASCMFFFISGLIIIHLKELQENERTNKQDYIRVNQKGKGETSSDTEVSENQISNKSKYKRAKKKAINSKKLKKDAGQN